MSCSMPFFPFFCTFASGIDNSISTNELKMCNHMTYMYGQNIVNILGFRTRPTGASSGR